MMTMITTRKNMTADARIIVSRHDKTRDKSRNTEVR
jgi:hypothetical protein